MLNTHGSFETSIQAVVYEVSALGAVTVWISTGGIRAELQELAHRRVCRVGCGHVGKLPAGHVHRDQRVAVDVGVDRGADRLFDTGLSAGGRLRARIRARDQRQRNVRVNNRKCILAFHCDSPHLLRNGNAVTVGYCTVVRLWDRRVPAPDSGMRASYVPDSCESMYFCSSISLSPKTGISRVKFQKGNRHRPRS